MWGLRLKAWWVCVVMFWYGYSWMILFLVEVWYSAIQSDSGYDLLVYVVYLRTRSATPLPPCQLHIEFMLVSQRNMD